MTLARNFGKRAKKCYNCFAFYFEAYYSAIWILSCKRCFCVVRITLSLVQLVRMELYLWLSLTWYFLMYFLMMFGLSTAYQNQPIIIEIRCMVFYKVSSEIIISLHSLITWSRSVLLSVILYLLDLHDGTSSPKSKSKLKSDIYISFKATLDEC